MRSEFVAAAVVAAMLAAVAGATVSWGAESQSYSPKEVLSVPYGPADGQPGRRAGAGEAVGPTAITVDASGTIAIADPAKGRVALFDRAGSFVASLSVEGFPVDAVSDGAGFAVLTAARQVQLYDATGKKQASQALAEDVSRDGLRRLSVAKGAVWALTGRGDSFKVASVKEGKGVPEKLQSSTRTHGDFEGSSAFDCSYEQGGHVVRYASDGNAELEVWLAQDDLATVSVAGEDASRAFYVIAEIGTPAGCRTECLKYSAAGRLLARFEVASDESWTARSTTVAPDGTVYRLVSGDDVLHVIAYSQGGTS